MPSELPGLISGVFQAIFLVGGFGSSEYLKQCLAKKNPNIQVIQPVDAWSAIVKSVICLHPADVECKAHIICSGGLCSANYHRKPRLLPALRIVITVSRWDIIRKNPKTKVK